MLVKLIHLLPFPIFHEAVLSFQVKCLPQSCFFIINFKSAYPQLYLEYFCTLHRHKRSRRRKIFHRPESDLRFWLSAMHTIWPDTLLSGFRSGNNLKLVYFGIKISRNSERYPTALREMYSQIIDEYRISSNTIPSSNKALPLINPHLLLLSYIS